MLKIEQVASAPPTAPRLTERMTPRTARKQALASMSMETITELVGTPNVPSCSSTNRTGRNWASGILGRQRGCDCATGPLSGYWPNPFRSGRSDAPRVFRASSSSWRTDA
jgi:hypothetical protein